MAEQRVAFSTLHGRGSVVPDVWAQSVKAPYPRDLDVYRARQLATIFARQTVAYPAGDGYSVPPNAVSIGHHRGEFRALETYMIKVSLPTLDQTGEGTMVRATITGTRFEYDLRFQTSVELTVPFSEPFVLPAVLAGMGDGEAVEIQTPVSGALLERLPDIQRILSTWYPSLKPVRVHAPVDMSHMSERPAVGVATFFSGGVDSFATVLRHQAELTALLLVRGSDVSLSNDSQWTVVRERCARAADELGFPLVTVATNVRGITERAGEWNTLGHGAGFAAVALLFQQHYRTAYLASSFSVADLFPWGSHPLLDPMFSTERTTIVHDAQELTRQDKIAFIAGHNIAMRHLRVCIKQTGAYNCGNCEKCLRTAVGLHFAGALGRCGSFPYSALPVDQLRTLWIPDEHALPFLRENIQSARKAGEVEVMELLEAALWRFELRQSVAKTRRLAASARLSRVSAYSRRALARVVGLDPAHQQ